MTKFTLLSYILFKGSHWTFILLINKLNYWVIKTWEVGIKNCLKVHLTLLLRYQNFFPFLWLFPKFYATQRRRRNFESMKEALSYNKNIKWIKIYWLYVYLRVAKTFSFSISFLANQIFLNLSETQKAWVDKLFLIFIIKVRQNVKIG